ncbi:phosphonate ABC transporter, permease protein PhnE [Vibrio agarivorans]|uniref:Phosphonate ABC transporter, permease protein PhnE n=1 Tax=Vibrio agarivorans TaxID=153622 RepID=A0ABT7Y6D2_9VIBR|nr:phosphonate ABC transporter, permease protein PhnE [Vibrio agarivorans]MDN2483613.1 phosphonate ABC transporter, permease protein PhnE [Vibrio agarivorans]MDN3660591.1 phosphonate ABC transporter, permease protein PhnE [Vibrio agarivorans]
MNSQSAKLNSLPPRFEAPSIFTWVIALVLIAFFVNGFASANITTGRLTNGVSNLGIFLGDAFPPNFSRVDVIAKAMLETFQMAIVGVVFGVIFSLPMALLCARNTTPHPIVRMIAVNVVSTFRTIPDLVWALVFVIAVGLGPLAGILAIVMDTIGFCARFFAERIEEIDPGPSRALNAIGAKRSSVVMGAVIPECLPSFVATSLFSVEKAVRSAVVLGLVGAGGIGVELSASMNLFRYDQALTVILAILVVVIGVERVSGMIRRKIM